MFSAAGIEKHLHKFALTRYPWKITTYTPYFTGIYKTKDIVQETRNELDERNIGGNLHKVGCVLYKIKATNE